MIIIMMMIMMIMSTVVVEEVIVVNLNIIQDLIYLVVRVVMVDIHHLIYQHHLILQGQIK